jgi:hypothetical protein
MILLSSLEGWILFCVPCVVTTLSESHDEVVNVTLDKCRIPEHMQIYTKTGFILVLESPWFSFSKFQHWKSLDFEPLSIIVLENSLKMDGQNKWWEINYTKESQEKNKCFYLENQDCWKHPGIFSLSRSMNPEYRSDSQWFWFVTMRRCNFIASVQAHSEILLPPAHTQKKTNVIINPSDTGFTMNHGHKSSGYLVFSRYRDESFMGGYCREIELKCWFVFWCYLAL